MLALVEDLVEMRRVDRDIREQLPVVGAPAAIDVPEEELEHLG